MNLSHRASHFLSKLERLPSTTNREDIIRTFENNNVPVFEPLIDFQQKFSGYKVMVGLEEIHFGLLLGDGSYPSSIGTAIVEFSSSKGPLSQYEFVCATSEYQTSFTLDEFGRYYEDGRVLASCFDKYVEHLAVWNEVQTKNNFQVLIRDRRLKVPDLPTTLSLQIIAEASDEFTSWFRDDSTYLRQNGALTTIFAMDRERLKVVLGSEFDYGEW